MDNVKIPVDLFSRDEFQELNMYKHGDMAMILYLKLLCLANVENGKYIFKFMHFEMSIDIVCALTSYKKEECIISLQILEEQKLIELNDYYIEVKIYWNDLFDRNSTEYSNWRTSVFKRDQFTCKFCGSNKKINAHHKIPWSVSVEKRFDVDNGITLCEKCHREIHREMRYEQHGRLY